MSVQSVSSSNTQQYNNHAAVTNHGGGGHGKVSATNGTDSDSDDILLQQILDDDQKKAEKAKTDLIEAITSNTGSSATNLQNLNSAQPDQSVQTSAIQKDVSQLWQLNPVELSA